MRDCYRLENREDICSTHLLLCVKTNLFHSAQMFSESLVHFNFLFDCK